MKVVIHYFLLLARTKEKLVFGGGSGKQLFDIKEKANLKLSF